MGEGSHSSIKHSRRTRCMRSYLGGLVLFSIAPQVALKRWKLSMGGWVWELGKGFKHQTWSIGAVLGVGTDVYCSSPSLITDTYWMWGVSYEPPRTHSGQARDMPSRGQRSKPLLTTTGRGSMGCRILPCQQPDVWGRTVLRGISLVWAARPGCTGLSGQEARQRETIP